MVGEVEHDSGVHLKRQHAEALREEVTAVLAPLGLRPAPDKPRVVHIDEGFGFLGDRTARGQQAARRD